MYIHLIRAFFIPFSPTYLPTYTHTYIQPEAQTVEDLRQILDEHGLITEGVMEIIGSGQGKNVEIVKARGR